MSHSSSKLLHDGPLTGNSNASNNTDNNAEYINGRSSVTSSSRSSKSPSVSQRSVSSRSKSSEPKKSTSKRKSLSSK